MSDQIAITRTVTVAAGVFAPVHLGELTQLIPFEMVDEVLAATRRVQQRVRLLPARVVDFGTLIERQSGIFFGRQPWIGLIDGC